MAIEFISIIDIIFMGNLLISKSNKYNGRVDNLRQVLEDGTLPLNERLQACVRLLRSLTHP